MTTQAGLFQLDMTDHHAVLGFSLAAEPSKVRKRYLKVARQLHPDSLREVSGAQRQLASELLSKQVNPAYEALSQDKSMKEHKILLKMKQKQLMENASLVPLTSDVAKNLLESKRFEKDYESAIAQIAKTQYNDLNLVQDAINTLSELNAVYLRRQTINEPDSSANNQPSTGSSASDKADATAKPEPRRSYQSSIIESYLKRAEEFEAQKDYSRGILELREAIGSHPKSASCHAYLASLYLKSGQATLAKIHAKQALTFEPKNELAIKVQKRVDRGSANAAKGSQNSKASGSKKGGGLLSGLFGGKKR
ncbi:MAG: J domain-containing protein [Cyanobacteria bacterium J06627_28]